MKTHCQKLFLKLAKLLVRWSGNTLIPVNDEQIHRVRDLITSPAAGIPESSTASLCPAPDPPVPAETPGENNGQKKQSTRAHF